MSETAIDPAVREAGRQQFILCQACHGADGMGVANLAPPLAGSEWVMGPAENLIRIQLRGLQGPIEVKGTKYEFVAPMPPQAFQTDEQMAQVLTYVRNSFGNRAPAVLPEDVAALRSEAGKPSLTEADLIPPKPTAEAEAEAVAEEKPEVEPYQINTSSPLGGWIVLILACVLAVGVFMTTMPFLLAAARSTLSTPMPARPTTFRLSAASMTSSVTLVALRMMRPL